MAGFRAYTESTYQRRDGDTIHYTEYPPLLNDQVTNVAEAIHLCDIIWLSTSISLKLNLFNRHKLLIKVIMGYQIN